MIYLCLAIDQMRIFEQINLRQRNGHSYVSFSFICSVTGNCSIWPWKCSKFSIENPVDNWWDLNAAQVTIHNTFIPRMMKLLESIIRVPCFFQISIFGLQIAIILLQLEHVRKYNIICFWKREKKTQLLSSLSYPLFHISKFSIFRSIMAYNSTYYSIWTSLYSLLVRIFYCATW